MSNYPLAFRPEPAGGGLSNTTPAKARPTPTRSPVGRPANDNFRPFPLPANDNKPLRVPTSRLGLVARRLPWIGIALTAYELYEWYTQSTYDDGLQGVWTKGGNCSSPGTPWGGKPDTIRFSTTNNPENHSWHGTCDACLNLQAPSSWNWEDYNFITNSSVILRQRFHTSARVRNIESYWRPASRKGTTDPMPVEPSTQTQPRTNPESVPEAYTAIEPLAPPLTTYVPVEVPYSVVPDLYGEVWNPTQNPETHGHGYGSAPATASPPQHPSPPGPGVRERKIRVAGSAGILRIINGVTEALDFVNALHQALPEQYRTPNARPQQQLIDLYNNYQHIDPEQAITNLVLEQVEDYLYGRASQLANTNQLNFREVPIGNLVGPAL